MTSQFAFLHAEWPGVHEAAAKAETAALADPRTACFYARRAVELLVHWVYKHDTALELPYQENISALIHDPTFQKAAGNAVFRSDRGDVYSRSHEKCRWQDASDRKAARLEILYERQDLFSEPALSPHAREQNTSHHVFNSTQDFVHCVF